MDVDTADQLQGITITALASIGELELNGANVTIGQSISQSDINAGALTFTPLGNDNGVGYDSFAYKVNDGVADSSASATMTIDVDNRHDQCDRRHGVSVYGGELRLFGCCHNRSVAGHHRYDVGINRCART